MPMHKGAKAFTRIKNGNCFRMIKIMFSLPKVCHLCAMQIWKNIISRPS